MGCGLGVQGPSSCLPGLTTLLSPETPRPISPTTWAPGLAQAPGQAHGAVLCVVGAVRTHGLGAQAGVGSPEPARRQEER